MSPHLEVPFAMKGDVVTDSGCGRWPPSPNADAWIPRARRAAHCEPRAFPSAGVCEGGVPKASTGAGPGSAGRTRSCQGTARLPAAARRRDTPGQGPCSRALPGASGLHRGRRWSRTGREAVGRQTWRNNYRGDARRGNGIGRRGSPPSEAVRGGGRDPRRGEAARAGAGCRGPEPARVQGWREGPEALGGAFRAPGSGSDALRFPLRREPPFRELFRNSCHAVAR